MFLIRAGLHSDGGFLLHVAGELVRLGKRSIGCQGGHRPRRGGSADVCLQGADQQVRLCVRTHLVGPQHFCGIRSFPITHPPLMASRNSSYVINLPEDVKGEFLDIPAELNGKQSQRGKKAQGGNREWNQTSKVLSPLKGPSHKVITSIC